VKNYKIIIDKIEDEEDWKKTFNFIWNNLRRENICKFNIRCIESDE